MALTADAKCVFVRLHSTQGVVNSLQCNPSTANSDKCITLTLFLTLSTTTQTLTLTTTTLTLTLNAHAGALSPGVRHRREGITNPLRQAPGVDF